MGLNYRLHLENYVRIVICYAQSGAKFPIDWLMPLTSAVSSDKFKLIKMPNGWKNATDFGITFWAGVLMSELPDSGFTIVSKDSDLDHVVNILINQNRFAERVGLKINNNQIPSKAASELAAHDRQIQENCLHLVNHNKNRPAKKETLINNIKSKFKDNTAIIPDEVFNRLIKTGAVILKESGNKVGYNDQKIISLSKVA